MFNIFKNSKTPTKFNSDYVSINNSQISSIPLPNGYPCSYDSDCISPSVCQFNVCTSNYTLNEGKSVYELCKGISPVECAKQMQKQRENEEISVFIPSENTGNNDIPYKTCKLDSDCQSSEFCISNVCLDKKNFPLIARHKKVQKLYNSQNEQQHDDYYYF
jgi:hypothetical protein